jgi:hypothetical protein
LEKTLNQLHGLLADILARRGRRLARKLPLTAAKHAAPPVTRIHQGLVRYRSGFDRFDPVTRAGKAMKCCWVFGPKAEFDLTMDRGGRFHLVFQYSCPLKDQVVAIRTATRFLGEFPLNFSPAELRTLEVPIFGSVGTQLVTIYPKKRAHHQAVAPERAAFRLYGLAVVPRAE